MYVAFHLCRVPLSCMDIFKGHIHIQADVCLVPTSLSSVVCIFTSGHVWESACWIPSLCFLFVTVLCVYLYISVKRWFKTLCILSHNCMCVCLQNPLCVCVFTQPCVCVCVSFYNEWVSMIMYYCHSFYFCVQYFQLSLT